MYSLKDLTAECEYAYNNDDFLVPDEQIKFIENPVKEFNEFKDMHMRLYTAKFIAQIVLYVREVQPNAHVVFELSDANGLKVIDTHDHWDKYSAIEIAECPGDIKCFIYSGITYRRFEVSAMKNNFRLEDLWRMSTEIFRLEESDLCPEDYNMDKERIFRMLRNADITDCYALTTGGESMDILNMEEQEILDAIDNNDDFQIIINRGSRKPDAEFMIKVHGNIDTSEYAKLGMYAYRVTYNRSTKPK